MIVLLYSSLFSYMMFFSVCIAPVIASILDKKNSSKLLRKIFPRNFIYGLIISLLLIISSFFLENKTSFIISIIIFLFFIINLFILITKINLEADKSINKKSYSSKFKALHLCSVLLFLIQTLLSFSMLIKEIIF